MKVANRQDFLACLDCCPKRNALEVFVHAKLHLLAALAEVGFDDFRGHDYEVMGLVAKVLYNQESDAALWGLVFVDLWYCSNFGGQHWDKLINRDLANVRFAIQAAQWVFAVSGADGGRTLAALISRCGCWHAAQRHIPREMGNQLRWWWTHNVLPYRDRARA